MIIVRWGRVIPRDTEFVGGGCVIPHNTLFVGGTESYPATLNL